MCLYKVRSIEGEWEVERGMGGQRRISGSTVVDVSTNTFCTPDTPNLRQ